MASIDTGGGNQKKGKPQQKTLRVDFTPMVDMMMLLITFFMFCTTLAKPQIMDIAMPTDDKNLTEEEQDKIKESDAITVLLGEDHKVYYYTGMITDESYADYKTLSETNFSASGIRDVLLKRNAKAISQMKELKKKKQDKQITEGDFKKQAADIKKAKGTPVVVIKATEQSVYNDLVDILDEMQICSIGKYAIIDITEGDKFLVENYRTKGKFAQENLAPKKK